MYKINRSKKIVINGFVQHTSQSLKVKIFYHFSMMSFFFNNKKRLKKGIYLQYTILLPLLLTLNIFHTFL